MTQLETIYGYTLAHGGCTFTAGEMNPSEGYAVGGFAPHKYCAQLDYEMFKQLALEFEAMTDKHYVVGTWVKEGLIVFDLVDIFDDKHDALRMANILNQEAIFDLANNVEIMSDTSDKTKI